MIRGGTVRLAMFVVRALRTVVPLPNMGVGA